jgi:hypothetical protein
LAHKRRYPEKRIFSANGDSCEEQAGGAFAKCARIPVYAVVLPDELLMPNIDRARV